jgi:hypothetical protein
MVNQTGKDLEVVGAKSLGEFILEVLKEQRWEVGPGFPGHVHEGVCFGGIWGLQVRWCVGFAGMEEVDSQGL